MALVVTVRPFDMDGRHYPVPSILSADDAAKVRANPALLRLCVLNPSIPDGKPTPDLSAAPAASSSSSEGT